MVYITLLDQFHPGIYSSQVIDVCDYLNKKYNTNIRVIAFLSIREIKTARPKLKKLSPNAIVLPAFPGLRFFRLTSFFLFFVLLFTGERVAICRNAFCTVMALALKKWGLLKTIVLDGRGSLNAEIKEYDVFPVEYLRRNIGGFEKKAVNLSDFRMAVSNQLVNYWQQHYGYKDSRHIVVPCTLDRKYFTYTEFTLSTEVPKLKKELGISESDIVLVYAGSTAPWQSFGLLEKVFSPLLETDPRIKLLFLSKKNEDNEKLSNKFSGRIIIRWVEHQQVLSHLQCGDYGILLREQSDTNRVASPTKFAEYLSSGLQVLISENLGDFSDFVLNNRCGIVLKTDSSSLPVLEKTSAEQKRKNFKLAYDNFRKESAPVTSSYEKMMEFLKISGK